MKLKISHFAIIVTLLCGQLISSAAETGLDIERTWLGEANAKPIALAMSGFSGEVDSVLRFDLFVMGCEFVEPMKAQYIVQGENTGRVEGRLFDAINKKEIFGKAFTGGSARTQAHALADEIAEAVTHGKGIAKTKIAFKVERPGGSEIAVADFDGHNAHIVTSDHSIVAKVGSLRPRLTRTETDATVFFITSRSNTRSAWWICGFAMLGPNMMISGRSVPAGTEASVLG